MHVLGRRRSGPSSRSISVDDVEVVKGGIERFDAGNSHLRFESQLEWRSKVGLNLHRALGLKVHPHSAVGLLWLRHLADCCFPEVGWECAALGVGKREQFLNHAVDEGVDAHLLDEFGMVCGFKDNTGWVESNWTAAC